jgi:hypothetical protein
MAREDLGMARFSLAISRVVERRRKLPLRFVLGGLATTKGGLAKQTSHR